jgi:GxxExxY protein
MRAREDFTSALIIEAIIRVHRTLGPGFLEKVYQRALTVELQRRRLRVQTEKTVVITYEGIVVGTHRLDLVIEQQAIVEVKTVEAISKAHYAQVRSYLKATGLRLGILVNFAGTRADYRRVE